MARWTDGVLTGFDLETTGTDPETARIVSAACVTVGAGREREGRPWLVAVDVEIPEEASKVHGITTVRARTDGRPLAEVLSQLAGSLGLAWGLGPVVAFNASYDFTILTHELDRAGLDGLALGPILDPYVIDKQLDKWRKGSRKLGDMARHYHVRLEQEHDALGDALTACRLAWALGTTFTWLGDEDPQKLHARQVDWASEQREGLERYFRKQDPKARVDRGWPITHACDAAGRVAAGNART